jgi:thiol-disulfide isomerase/thioredoxin
VILCNFWATWCTPCREEIPLLDAARQQRAKDGFEVVGIGIDPASKIAEFAANFKISYPILIGDSSVIDLMRGIGNRQGALPYTVAIDRQGRLAYRHLGAFSREDLGQVLAGLLG